MGRRESKLKTLEAKLAANTEHILALRGAIKEELSGGQCVDCGEADERVLDFDHLSGVKLFDISNAIKMMVSLPELRLEIAKCVLRCRNCHIKKHDRWGGEHYYTSKHATEQIIARTERAVTKAYLREVADELGREEGQGRVYFTKSGLPPVTG